MGFDELARDGQSQPTPRRAVARSRSVAAPETIKYVRKVVRWNPFTRVFDGEPNLHKGYLELDNAFLLPHQGSGTVETRTAMGFMALDNLDAFFAGQEPPNRVA